ncbi:NUDIX hydrolase [Frankia sp. Mgl5]|uniref:NUDIX hydrolase n=1 Tax=Frankia sp. Mgl5 TaxID=2933793 RepID=UPI00200F81DF|nr:NUDIX hydrolase [Frankia sp. Mgl5]MCK9926473.1 NUDIX hydrolase [Frankia sp. Mgl5]
MTIRRRVGGQSSRRARTHTEEVPITRFTWHPKPAPAKLPVRQVYGFLFAADGRLLLLVDRGRCSLPGGRPEPGEDAETTLRREAHEEVAVVLGQPVVPLGYQHVDDEDGSTCYAQVRMVGPISAVLPAAPDPATGRQYQRLLVPPAQAGALLDWGEHGHRQVAAATEAAVVILGLPRDDFPNEEHI